MDQLVEVTNVKNEPTDSTSIYQSVIPTEMKVKILKQESDCLIHSEINIKMEAQEDEIEFPVIAGTCYYMCPNYDMKIEMEEPLIKTESDNLIDVLLQDPLNVGDKIKVGEQISSYLDQGESRIKTEPTDGGNEKNLLDSDEDDSYGSGSNQAQELLIKNDPDCSNKKNICDVCDKSFRWKSELDKHLRIHTGEKPFICDICEKSFIHKGHLNTHMLIHSDVKPYTCDVCSRDFRHKSSFNEHKLMHSVGEKPFPCDACDKSFTRKQDFVVHRRIHSSDKPFACYMCKKTFTQKPHLTRHERLHTGEKPYACDICKKSFTQKTNLNRHKKIHKN